MLLVVILFTILIQRLATFLWIYRPLHRTDLFIVIGAHLEYTKKKFMVNDAVLE